MKAGLPAARSLNVVNQFPRNRHAAGALRLRVEQTFPAREISPNKPG
jgi:hypothetical protein